MSSLLTGDPSNHEYSFLEAIAKVPIEYWIYLVFVFTAVVVGGCVFAEKENAQVGTEDGPHAGTAFSEPSLYPVNPGV